MSYAKAALDYAIPNDREVEDARQSSRILSPRVQRDQPLELQVVGNYQQAETIHLPPIAVQMLLKILVHLSEGKAITIVPTQAELTTQQAADLLNISRPSLVRLLEHGAMPFHKVGSHRRILFSDLRAFQEQTQRAREASLADLSALSQELGLDD